MDKKIMEKIGDEHQLYGAQQYRLCGGKGDGMRMVELRNRKGLRAEIAADRCMDIYRLEYKGVNFSYMTPAGMVGPTYYQPEDFLRSFTGGFFTTCGLLNFGSPCKDEYSEGVVHGRIGQEPAEYLCVDVDDQEDKAVLNVSGRMRESILFKEKIDLKRHISMNTENNTIILKDTVTNIGGEKQPLEILYHMNIGYPLLDSFDEICIPAKKTVARDPRAQEGIDDWMNYKEPVSGFKEQCYYHTLKSKDGFASFMVYNPKLKLGVMVSYTIDTLDYFTQWKMPGVKDYVLGLEPGNARVQGRVEMAQTGDLKFIQPGEKVNYELHITVVDGDEEYAKAKAHIESLN